jgi:hypothetical protein
VTAQPQDATETQQTQSPQTSWNPFAALGQVGLLALGAVDLVLDQVRQAADRGQGAVRRSDLRELVEDGLQDLKVRGELASRRVAASDSENYLELMARRAIDRTARADAASATGAKRPGPAHRDAVKADASRPRKTAAPSA